MKGLEIKAFVLLIICRVITKILEPNDQSLSDVQNPTIEKESRHDLPNFDTFPSDAHLPNVLNDNTQTTNHGEQNVSTNPLKRLNHLLNQIDNEINTYLTSTNPQYEPAILQQLLDRFCAQKVSKSSATKDGKKSSKKQPKPNKKQLDKKQKSKKRSD